VRTYRAAGYALIELPYVSVEERAQLILNVVAENSGERY